MFVNEFDSDEDELICINSWGSIEDEPIIKTIQVSKANTILQRKQNKNTSLTQQLDFLDVICITRFGV